MKGQVPGGISAAAPGALGTTMYGKRPATGGTMGAPMTNAGQEPTPVLNRPWVDPGGEMEGRPTPRPMGPSVPYDGGGINPNGNYDNPPRRGYRRGPRSNQPGHGNGNGAMTPGDVKTKGTQNIAGRLLLLNKGQMGVPTPEGGPVYTPGGANEEFLRGGGGGWA